MKVKTVTVLLTLAVLTYGAGFMDMGMSGNTHIMLSSDKVLSVGENSITVELNAGAHGGERIRADDVRIKFFMPEMPGMPYMESKDICKNVDNRYQCRVNFGMNGTWQYQLFVKGANGQDFKYKGSVNLGQASSGHNH